MKFTLTTFTAILLSATVASAAKMNSMCTLVDGKVEVEGVNQEKLYNIASVSKIMTSYWAMKTLGSDFRFSTVLHINPSVDEGYVDIHLEGGMDPYFNREMLQYMVVELNRIGIRKVKNLTFDEGFKFLASTRRSDVAIGNYSLQDPLPDRVQVHLTSVAQSIANGYSTMRRRARDIGKMQLPAEISFRVRSVKHLKAEDFSKKTDWAQSKKMVLKSVALPEILKEMNRNSNNYSANIIFESLGGGQEFNKFILNDLGLSDSEIKFFNGSGDRLDIAKDVAVYNQASCSAILAVFKAFQDLLRKEDMALQDVMALAGSEPDDEPSTTSSIYGGSQTSGALIGKTGTVCDAVSLAGMASTNQGDIFYAFIYGTQCTTSDWRNARLKIRNGVIDLFSKNRQKRTIPYRAAPYMSFDEGSALTELMLQSNGVLK